MNPLVFVPLVLGVMSVLQGSWNQKFSETWGLTSVLFVNALVFLVCSLILILLAWMRVPWLPDFLKDLGTREWRNWFLVPGIFGFFFVLGIPWSIRNIGPAKTFVVLIGAQVLLGLVLDALSGSAQLNELKIAGALLTALGAGLIMIA